MKEIRNNEHINSSSESRTVEGYAIVFDSESKDLGGFTEIISRNAISQETLNKSDILFLLDHNKERGVLARSRNGNGSLNLEIDDRGVKFSFEAPETALGDEILIGLRRGDISQCSFAFTVAEDRWEKRNDGSILRTVESISELFDMAIVYNPAYDSTIVVNKRGLDELMKEEEIRKEEEEKEKEEEVEETGNSNENESEKEEKSEDKEEEKEEEKEEKETESEEETEDKEQKNCEDKKDERSFSDNNLYNKEIRNNKNTSMSKKFSLIKTINDVVNNRNLDDNAQAIIKEGRSAMQKAGLKSDDKIILPFETRAEGDAAVGDNAAVADNANGIIMATVATQGMENVATDKFSILEPLRANLIMTQCGATVLSNLVGNISIPRYSKSNCQWKGESVKAEDGKGAFDEITLSPKRLTSYIKISNQFLMQDSNSADELLRRDLIAALSEKLESTVFGNVKGSANQPEGLFYNVTADTAALKYDDIIDAEAVLEEANVPNYVYVLSPSAKAVLRKTKKDAGSGRFVMEDSEIEGRKAYVSSNVQSKGLLIADMSDLVVGLWGGISLTIDPYTYADEDCVRIVANMYVDVKPRRDESFVKRILK